MKKFVKSTLSLLLVFVTVLTLVACNPTGSDDEETLIVGSPEISGEFLSGFGNSSYDVWVRNLVYGHGTYVGNKFGQIVLNETAVDSVDTSVDSEGNKTYTFVIHDDLLWSDGTSITAKDYVWAMLMQASQEWVAAGAASSAGDTLLGYDDYRSGDVSADVRFKGVQLISDLSFSLTIAAEELPYFYETVFVSLSPLPMHRLAPEGTTIDSNADGAKVGVDGFSTLSDHARVGGYRYTPDVTSGPYKFVSFVNQVVTLVKDEKLQRKSRR